MGFPGISAGSQLDGMNAESGQNLQGFVKRLRAVEIGKYAEFHGTKTFLSCVLAFILTSPPQKCKIFFAFFGFLFAIPL